MRRLASLLLSVAAFVTPSYTLEVSVCGDATYDLPDDRGMICASADPVPPGTACPLKGDKASTDCFENLSSYDGGACVAPEDAVCALVTDKTWGCVFPSIGCGDKTITTTAPAPIDQCETWDYDEDDSPSSVDAEALFDGNEDYDESWFVEVTKVTVLFACETEKPTAAPTSKPTPAPTIDSTNIPVADPTPAPTDYAESSASEPTPAPTSHTDDDTTDTAISDSGDASVDSSSGTTDESSTTTASDSGAGDATDSSESEPTPAPTSDSTSKSGPIPGPAPSDNTGSSASDTDAKPTPAPTSDTAGALMSDRTDGTTPEVTPAATNADAQQQVDDTQSSRGKATVSNEATDGSTSTKQSTGFSDVMLLSGPLNFIGTLKPASMPDAPNAYDKPSR